MSMERRRETMAAAISFETTNIPLKTKPEAGNPSGPPQCSPRNPAHDRANLTNFGPMFPFLAPSRFWIPVSSCAPRTDPHADDPRRGRVLPSQNQKGGFEAPPCLRHQRRALEELPRRIVRGPGTSERTAQGKVGRDERLSHDLLEDQTCRGGISNQGLKQDRAHTYP